MAKGLCINNLVDIKTDSVKIITVIDIDNFGILAKLTCRLFHQNSFRWIPMIPYQIRAQDNPVITLLALYVLYVGAKLFLLASRYVLH
jgi:hypothetical protein